MEFPPFRFSRECQFGLGVGEVAAHPQDSAAVVVAVGRWPDECNGERTLGAEREGTPQAVGAATPIGDAVVPGEQQLVPEHSGDHEFPGK